LLRKAISCFGCSRNVNVFLLLTGAAAGDEDLWLEVDAAAFDIVAYMVAVFFGGEPRDSEFAAVDAQPRNVHGFRRCGICDLNDLLKVFVGLRLARARAAERDQVAYDAAVERFSRLGWEVLARQTRSNRIFSARMAFKR
jgi:hypothetical protein